MQIAHPEKAWHQIMIFAQTEYRITIRIGRMYPFRRFRPA
jgi:hypothetical protein